jgi:16S rRNA (uracil1498-N3)-methyltransferase
MKQFLLPRSLNPDEETVELAGKDHHYLCHVRRLVPGDRIQARDTEGKTYRLELTEKGADSSIYRILERGSSALSGDIREIHLFQALPKGKKMDLIIRQAAETGVSRIIPLESDHSLIKFSSPKERASKKERWDRIVREARQQSGSPVSTELEEPAPFSRLAEAAGDDFLGFFCHQDPLDEDLIAPVLSAAGQEKRILGIVIGPEGGLSPAEVDKLKKWGYHSVWFGDNVLRAETASLYGVAALKTMLRELF